MNHFIKGFLAHDKKGFLQPRMSIGVEEGQTYEKSESIYTFQAMKISYSGSQVYEYEY